MSPLEILGAVVLLAMVIVAFISGVLGDDKVLGDEENEDLDL